MRIAPPDLLRARCNAVAAVLATRNLDALVVTNLSNVAYLTGLFASAAAAVVTRERTILIGDGRYADALTNREEEAGTFLRTRLLPMGESYDEAVVKVLLQEGASRVGCEASHMTVARHNFVSSAMQRAGLTSLAGTDGIVEACRVRKDDWEIERMRDAAARLSEVAKCILSNVLAGRTESDVAAEIEQNLRRVGFDRNAFDTIVASGPNAARPHARASQRRIERGDLVVMDFGGVLDGYCSDLTRTVTAGPAGAQERRLIEQVIDAQAAAFAAVTPGGPPEAVDAAARNTLTRYGIGDAFTHGTGHGLGLDVHEAPRVSRARPDHPEPLLAAGMVMTLEPGAYFPGWGGVRVEDDVLVTSKGAEWLTDVPRTL
jgi:Xaa-Pro aminopeptidase